VRLKKAIEIFKAGKSFLIAAHQSPEGDAIGSQLAMYHLLRRMGKKNICMYNHDPVPQNLTFLPGSKNITTEDPGRNFDVGIVLDCSDLMRLGRVKDAFEKVGTLVNIDHHVSNTKFGEFNIVDGGASSASELVYRLYKRVSSSISKEAALCMYTGVFTDTGAFTYSYTSSAVHRIASELLADGVKPSQVYTNVYSSLDMDDVHFVGKTLASSRVDDTGKLCWVVIPKWRESEVGDLTETIFHNMRFLKDVEVFMLFKKVRAGAVRVNFRSRGSVDVNKIAKFFGGGGHKKASGTTIESDFIADVENRVVEYVKRHV
jgi:phosphoesterase RecJ-like protein